MPTTVEVDRPAEHVTRLTLNRPERLNALDYRLTGDLHDALDDIAADADCRVVVLTGAGRGFCAGLDLKDWGRPPSPGEHRRAAVGVGGQEFMANLTVHLRQTPQIVIAAVNGVAFGGGLSLACACDLRVASSTARFCSAFIRTGLTGTDIGISYLLPRLIGASRAFDMIVTGREVDAEEAERIGLVSRVVPDAASAAVEMAALVAGYTATGLTLTKEVMWHNLDTPSMTAAIAMENRNQTIASRAPDVVAFMDAYRSGKVGGPPRGDGGARP